MLIQTILEERARCTPDRIALVCDTRRISFGELWADAARFASALRERGIVRGDRVVVCVGNGPEAVAAIFGALAAGAVVVPIHAASRPHKLAAITADCEARALVVAGGQLDALADHGALAPLRTIIEVGPEGSAPRSPAPITRWDDALAQHEPIMERSSAIDLDLALLLYTSGSTGTPKGVMLTHRALTSISATIAEYLALSARDVVLSVLPLSFGYGLTQLLPTFLAGATLVLERSIAYPRQTLERMVTERVTGIAVVPTIASLLLRHELESLDLSSLRYVTNAGAALPPASIAALRARLPGADLISMYGQTECIRASFLSGHEVAARPRSVGRGLPNQELWVVDETGRRLPPGSTGELVVRGPHLMSGYWKRPEETARALRPGPLPGERVLHTGDLFEIDRDGYLYFVARLDDIIKSRGEKVSPREVEDALASFDGVREVVVLGMPHPILGAEVRAFVAPEAGVELEVRALLRHCAERLDDHAVPRRIDLLGELPRTPNAKIDKEALRRRLEEAT